MSDIGALRAIVEAGEALGYDHVRIAEHVLGANSASRPGWSGSYDHTQVWHDPFVLFGYVAAVTTVLELATSILVLPQRQAPLVANQAAEVDVLTGGRLRLGIGVGWNAVEFEALGEDFTNRGDRCEEQIEVMRALWTEELVTYDGRWHTITDAGINPLPVQRPIPIWIGGGPGATGSISDALADKVLRRIARVADGWFPSLALHTGVGEAADRLRGYMREYGRDPTTMGIEGSVSASEGGPDSWQRQVKAWADAGATHVSVTTGGPNVTTADDHIASMRRFKEAVID